MNTRSREPDVETALNFISRQLPKRVVSIFGDRLVASFVFGGFAKGYAAPGHDIDIFIVLDRREMQLELKFRDFYFDVHEALGLQADEDDPGEICTLCELQERITLAEQLTVMRTIETYLEYETIVWVDALASAKILLTPLTDEFFDIERRAKAVFNRWRGELIDIAPLELNASTLPTTILFEKIVHYEKRDPPRRYVIAPCRSLT